MGMFERKLKRKVMRDIKAEEKQAQIDEGLAAAERRLQNNVNKLEKFNEQLESTIKKYRQKAKEAQRNNNKAAFNSYVAQIINTQKLLDNNTMMLIDAIRHADSQQNNRSMMAAQAAIGEIVNPKLDISEKDMLLTREKFSENAMNLSSALARDEQFATMFDDIYTGEDTAADKGLFEKLSSDIASEVAHEEAARLDNDFDFASPSSDLNSLKEAMRREREMLESLRKR